jgi:CheY-like chemotaxis protein
MSTRILVADDDPAIVDSIKMLLEYEGYEVETATSGKAVKELKKDFPDLILLDIWMSGLNGGDICKLLKNEAKTHNIPVVLISAHRDTARIAKDVGADDFITKPFEIDDLLEKIKINLKSRPFQVSG